MKLTPFDQFVLKTNLSAEEVGRRLRDNTEREKSFSFLPDLTGSRSTKAYVGLIQGNAFIITPVINYKNSFLPRIKGHIETNGTETTVTISTGLHEFVFVFMMFWCGFASLATIMVLVSSIRNMSFEPGILVTLAMLLFGYGLMTGAFNYESAKSRKKLAALLDASIN
jgi:hypothetical protein